MVSMFCHEMKCFCIKYSIIALSSGRCLGPLNAFNIEQCLGADSQLATIDPSLDKTMFRFVPVKGEERTYRIILLDRSTKGCNRFLSAAKDCSVDSVFFVKSDLGGLQREVTTKVDPNNSSTLPPTNISSCYLHS